MIERLPFYSNFYEQPGLREEHVYSEERIPLTLKMVPSGVNSFLDLGCGEGTILEKMGNASLKVALDISYSTLKNVHAENKIISRSSDLPFYSNRYDLIICTEVLEHLQTEEFGFTIKEIERVAKKYILISVPYQENLSRKQALCPKCSYIYHIHMHMRSFGLPEIKTLFENFYLKRYKFTNTQEKNIPDWIIQFRRKYGHRWEWNENALCPRCGHKNAHPPRRSLISILTSLLGELMGKNHPKWIIALYKIK